jgi:hypothetical protein
MSHDVIGIVAAPAIPWTHKRSQDWLSCDAGVTLFVSPANGLDGIDDNTFPGTITKNRAQANEFYGIFAVDGSIDGGGNTAHDSAGPAQCAGPIACKVISISPPRARLYGHGDAGDRRR